MRVKWYYLLKNDLKMQKTALQIIVWKEGEHFVAQCLNVDVSSFGKTKEEAVKNLNEALKLYFEDYEGTIQTVENPEIIQTDFQYA